MKGSCSYLKWMFVVFVLVQATYILEISLQTTAANSRGQTVNRRITNMSRTTTHSNQEDSKNRSASFVGLASRCGDHVRLIKGNQRRKKGFLTVGLCTVPRENASYLKATIQSLIIGMSEFEREEVVIVVFLGYRENTSSKGVENMIEDNFSDNLNKGELQVVRPNMSIYPNFSQIERRTYNDSLSRVHWRTKQNIDFAHLFGYCDGFSEYYLHVEDDVLASKNYILEIKRSLKLNQKNQWFVLNFGAGFYGKLFRSYDLCMMKSTFLLFQEEKPSDLLLDDLSSIKLHDFKKIKDSKKLFEHIGKYSSLKGKTVKLKRDNKKPMTQTDTENRVYAFNISGNPPAVIETSMKVYSNFTPEKAYERNNDVFFWAETPVTGDYFRVVLKSPVNTTRLTVRTGHPLTGRDNLEYGVIFMNKEILANGTCRTSTPLGKLASGMFELAFGKSEEIKCLEIVVQSEQEFWVIIASIEIET